jgi:hypothetical protein
MHQFPTFSPEPRMIVRRAALAALALAPLVVGCNSGLPADSVGTTTGPVADLMPAPPPDLGPPPPPDLIDGQPSTSYPATFPDPPQVLTQGGPVLKSPRFVPVFFSDYDMTMAARLVDFATRLGPSAYWKATTSEYGVGAGTAAPAVMLAEASPMTIDDKQIQTWLAGKLNAADPAFPMPTAQDIYILHYPARTMITYFGTRSCQSFGGYHGNIQLDNAHHRTQIAYAVVPLCRSNLAGVDAVTSPESHELIEAATDPYPQSSPAYGTVDADHAYWPLLIGGAEVGDMCENLPSAYQKFLPEIPYVVQRTWSNAAILAGHDPCVPAPNEVYFNAVPELVDQVTVTAFGGQALGVMGASIPVGSSKVVMLDLISDGDTAGPIAVDARQTRSGMGQAPYLSFSFDRLEGLNGEKIQMTVNSLNASPRGAAYFVVTASVGLVTHSWYGVVDQSM